MSHSSDKAPNATLHRRHFLGGSLVALSVPLAPGLSAVAHAADPLVIVRDGEPIAAVVVADDADDQTRDAAQELITYVERATGATLPLQDLTTSRAESTDRPRVFVGLAVPDSAVTAEQLADLGQDAYLIRRSAAMLTIAGRDGWGTRYGVYEFCERYLDVRWLMTDDVVADHPSPGSDVPTRSSLSIGDADVQQAPAMIERTLHPIISPYPSRHAWDWEPSNPRVRTYNVTFGRYARLRHALEYQHNLWRVIPPATYGDPDKPDTYRPEFFPVHNGNRFIPTAGQQTGWQPNFRAEGIVEAAASEVLAHLRADPGSQVYSLSINDGQGFSDDDLDTDVVNHLGFASASESYFAFVNGVAELVAAEFPDVRIGVLAYTQVADPPSFGLHPNVIPMLTRDLYAWTREDVRTADHPWVAKWSETATQLGVWDYAWGGWYCLPRMYLHSLGKSFRFLHEHGVTAVMCELEPNWGEGPKPYVYSKLLWDPNLDVWQLVRDWCVHAVGRRAAPHLHRYFDLWEHFWTTTVPESAWFDFSSHRTYFLQLNADYLQLVSQQDLERAQRALDLAADRTTTPEQASRLAALQTTFDAYRAGALSYPRTVTAPTNRRRAIQLVDDTAGQLERNLSLVQQRAEIEKSLNGPDRRQRTAGTAQSTVWSGWNLDPVWKLGQYLRANEPTGGPVRDHVSNLAATAESDNVATLASLILAIANGEAIDANANPSFSPELPVTWQGGSGAGIVTDEIARSGGTSLKLPQGWRGPLLEWDVPVKPGLFRFQVHLHTNEQHSNVDGKIVTSLYDAGGTRLQRLSSIFSMNRNTDEWHQVAHSEMAGFGIARARCTLITIHHGGLPAPLYLDDASILNVPHEVAPPDAIVVEQDEFRLYEPSAVLVDDAAATDGRAARIPGTRSTWTIQYPLSKMPESGSYRIQARVRIEMDDGVPANETVLYIGAYRANPTYSRRNEFQASTFADGDYHWLSFSHQLSHDGQGMYLYFTGLADHPKVKWIYVDRLYLIPM